MTTAEVYLPCDVSRVRVKLGFGDTLSPLEEAALRVIAELSAPGVLRDVLPDDPSDAPADAVQRADVREVATLLGLGYRVVLDLVHDLWRAGYLVVDFSTNSIGLSAEVQQALENGRLSSLQGAETEDRTAELMVERLTGYVMPSDGPFAPVNQQLAVRFLEEESGVLDASQADIQHALRDWLRREPVGRQRRILSVRSAPADLSRTSGRRWFPLTIQAELNPDSDRLIIAVTDQRFPADRRDRAADRLTRLAEENPQDSWVTQLRNKAEQLRPTPPPVEELIARLDGRIADGGSLPPGRRRAEHLEWANETRRIDGLIRDRIAHEAEVEPVVGAAAHTKAIRQLIGEARTQLVLTCPRIVDYALREFRDQLLEAVDRGVQLVILWGGEYNSVLQVNVSNELDSLARRAKAAPVLRAQVSANTSVRMVVCDNRTALVTARDFLATTRDRPEVGLLLRRPAGQEGATLTDLLRWTRVNLPGSMSASVLRTASRFAEAAPHSHDQPAATQQENLPEEPPEDPEKTGAVQAWTMRWQAHLAGMRGELADRPLPALRLVEDGTHRELLWEALRNAQTRLVIASGQVSDEVMSSRMVDAIATLLARGVAITIGYDEQGGADRGKGAIAALRDLASTYPTLLTLTGATGHTRLLVWDDDVTVGSYSYLFHAGYGTVGGRHMLPSELSVRLRDPELASRVAAECGEPAGATARTADAAAAPAAAHGTDPAALHVVQRILNRAGELPPGQLVRAELGAVPDPWPVLDLLHLMAEPDVRRAAMAYCLAHGNPAPGTAARWCRRLISQLVRDGLFTEAGILRATPPGDPGGRQGQPARAPGAQPASGPVGSDDEGAPRSEVIDALFRHGQPGSDDVLLTAAFQDLDADEQAALLIVCAGDLLKSGSDDARNALEVLPERDGPWGDLERLAKSYHAQAGAPTAELMRDVARRQAADAWLEAAWDRLDLALLEAEPLPKVLDGAKKTKAALFRDTGIFGRLRTIAARRDLQALRALVTAEFPARPSPADIAGEILDRTWREVAPMNDLLDGRPRVKYLKRLGEVVAAARDIAVAGDPVDGRLGDGEAVRRPPGTLAAARTLADGYRRIRPLLGDTSVLGPIAAAAAGQVLPDLDRLMSGLAAEPEPADVPDLADDQPESGWDATAPQTLELAHWKGRWQYPELAMGLWAGKTDPVQIAALLLPGLVDPMPAVRTGRELIKAGEFAAVETLRGTAGLDNADSTALLSELLEAQARVGAQARYEAAALARRASRVDMAIPLSPEAVGEQAQRRWPGAKETLAEFRVEVTIAEGALAAKLSADVNADQAVLDGCDSVTGADAETVERWRRTVLACVEAREFPSARRVLAQRPGEAYIHDPRSYPLPRPVWPFPADLTESVLAWYFTEDLPDTPARFGSWRPAQQDTEGWGLLRALRDHVLEPTAHTAAALRDKLQRLVGVYHQGGLMTSADGGWAGRLFLQGGPQLPPFSLLSRYGIALWIADSGTPPPGGDGTVVVWLVTDFRPPARTSAGTAIIDLQFLFRLLAPAESGTAAAEARLVNVVRHLSAQLDAGQLVEESQPGAPPFSESDIGWFLDVLGVASDGVTAEALHYDTGGRVEVLLPLLRETLPPAGPGRGRYHPLDAATLQEAWDGGAWRPTAIDGLLAPLRNGSTVHAVARSLMWLAVTFYKDAFSLTDLAKDITLVATDEQAASLLPAADLEGAARELHRVRLFEPAPAGQWRLPANGIREILGGTWPEHDPERRAREAIEAWFRHHEREGALRRAVLSDDVVRMIGHLVANRMAAVRSALDAGEYGVAGHIVAKYSDIHGMYRNALDAEDVLALRQVLSNCKNEAEFLNPTRFQVTIPAEGEFAGLYVTANQWLLEHAFQNLLDNARLAGEKNGLEVGKVLVTVSLLQPGPGAERACQIDVEDNGAGFDPQVPGKLAAGEECTTWDGRGTGLRTADRWFREYRGSLKIMPGKSTLGGARIRVTLPLAPPPASALRDGQARHG